MSTSLGKAGSPVRRVRRQTSKRRLRTRHNVFDPMQVVANQAEDVIWRQLEEREEGRIAQESDHLFDTSFAWAA